MEVLKLENVSIRYMTGDFKDIGLKEYVMRRLKRDYQVTEFWADRNISFSLEQGDMLAWILAIVLVREFAVSGMRLVAVEKGRVIAAGWSGKIKTASTMVCICLILFGIPHWLNVVCQIVILVTTVYSGAEYFIKNADVFKSENIK